MGNGTRWYHRERPLSVWAGPITLNLFPGQGVLEFVSWRDTGAGRRVPGKSFAVWLRDLAKSPEAIELLEGFCQAARRKQAEGCNGEN